MGEAASGSSPGCGWMVGVGLAAVTVFALFATGVAGVGFGLVVVVLLAWKGPRLTGFGGYMVGLGGVFTILYGQVLMRCVTEGRSQGSGCNGGDIELATGIAAATLLAGLLATGLAARRAWRRRSGSNEAAATR